MFITETWLRQAGDEVKCADLAPPGFTAKSFPCSSQGGGLTIVLKDSLLPHFSWTTSLPFRHTSFELIHATLTLTQRTLHFYTLYRPPPNRKNKLTDSLFFEQFFTQQLPRRYFFYPWRLQLPLRLSAKSLHFTTQRSPLDVQPATIREFTHSQTWTHTGLVRSKAN